MDFIPIDEGPRGLPQAPMIGPAELRSETPVEARMLLREAGIATMGNPMDLRFDVGGSTIRMLNQLMQTASYRKNVPKCEGVEIYVDYEIGLHAVFMAKERNLLDDYVIVYDPNDYVTRRPNARNYPTIYSMVRPMLNIRESCLNIGPYAGIGVCYALSYAFCRIYKATDRERLERILRDPTLDNRAIIRFALGDPRHWADIIIGIRRPPSFQQLRRAILEYTDPISEIIEVDDESEVEYDELPSDVEYDELP